VSFLIISLTCFGFLVVSALATAFWLTASSAPEISAPQDVFGFASLPAQASDIDIPSLKRYRTRDGEELAYRMYDSSSERVLKNRA